MPDTRVDFRLYQITDRSILPPGSLFAKLEELLGCGIRAIQLREKDLAGRDLLSITKALRTDCSKHKAKLFVNERIDIALATNACGIHLPEKSWPVHTARSLFPKGLIARSTHCVESAIAAERDGADLITFSPIYPTPSKQQYGDPKGLAKLREVSNSVNIPVFALGGITPERAEECLEAGAYGVALISDLLLHPEPRMQVERYRNVLGSL